MLANPVNKLLKIGESVEIENNAVTRLVPDVFVDATGTSTAGLFVYSDLAMGEALYAPLLRPFAVLSPERIPDETTLLNFRRLLERYELATGILAAINGYLGDRGLSLRQGTIVDATLTHAPSSTKNQDARETLKKTSRFW